MPRVVIAFKMHRRGVEKLRANGIDFTMYDGRYPPREWFEHNLSDAEILVVTPIHRVDEEILSIAPKLRLVLLHGSGYDRIDIDACSRRRICVARVHRYVNEAVAEFALALALAAVRNVVVGDRFVRSGRWTEGPAPRALLSRSLRSLTVGIVGMGDIGYRVARLFRMLGVEVVYWSRRRKLDVEASLGVKYLDLDELLSLSDIVIVCLALTSETRRFIDRSKIFKMKRGSILINISRGEVIDTEALVEALREGHIALAALDVFEHEPIDPSHPLINLENTILTPHIAGYTADAMELTSLAVAETVIRFLRGEGLGEAQPINEDVCSVICT